MSVEQAVREGLLEVTERGTYRVPDASARQAQQLQQEQEQKAAEQAQLSAMVATGDAPDAEASAAIDLVTKHVPAQAVTHLIQDVAQNGSLSSESVAKVGKSLGWSEAQAQGAASQVYEGLRRQADAAAVHAGVPASETDALWSWAAQTQATEHSHAVLALAYRSDSAGLKKLAKLYLANKRDVARR
jgi:hypothetical protein